MKVIYYHFQTKQNWDCWQPWILLAESLFQAGPRSFQELGMLKVPAMLGKVSAPLEVQKQYFAEDLKVCLDCHQTMRQHLIGSRHRHWMTACDAVMQLRLQWQHLR